MSKKSFNLAGNPALQFITAGEQSRKPAQPASRPKLSQTLPAAPNPEIPPAGYKVVLQETKSRRVQLLIRPSLYDGMKDYATEKGISVNEAAHELIQKGLASK